MITDTPQIITQFRGNRSYSYIDDSTHVAGEPDMNCIQLNCLTPPFNDANVRLAAAMAVNRSPVRHGHRRGRAPGEQRPLRAGLALLLARRRIPAYNPSEAAKLVQAGREGQRRTDHLHATARPTRRPPLRAQQYLQQAWQAVGFQVKTTIVRAEQTSSTTPWPASTRRWRWRQFGAVDPDLNYIFWSTTTVSSGSLSINMARNADPKIEAALLAGPLQHRHLGPGRGLQDGQQAPGPRPALPVDGPGGLGRHRQPQRAELQQPHDAAGPARPSA